VSVAKNKLNDLKKLLEQKAALYNQPAFIAHDPIVVPHRFSLKQDVEIAAFFAAILAWGNRTTIINSAQKLMQLMDNAPYDFVLNHRESDLRVLLSFVHRTFNATDVLYFISFLNFHYQHFNSLEDAFVPAEKYPHENVKEALIHFYNYFFSLEHPQRTTKHIATPHKKSACKRINMFLRWMVRKDDAGVDFGIWRKLKPHQLVCPLDVHVARVSSRLGLLPNEKSNWENAVQLTQQLKNFNPQDPVLFDYALFGLGMAERL
jgi:uncharacterized protein (TIGR02757 family)